MEWIPVAVQFLRLALICRQTRGCRHAATLTYGGVKGKKGILHTSLLDSADVGLRDGAMERNQGKQFCELV